MLLFPLRSHPCEWAAREAQGIIFGDELGGRAKAVYLQNGDTQSFCLRPQRLVRCTALPLQAHHPPQAHSATSRALSAIRMTKKAETGGKGSRDCPIAVSCLSGSHFNTGSKRRKGTQRVHVDNSNARPMAWYSRAMKKPEFATARARLYPSTYRRIAAIARKRRTSLAQVISERFSRG